MEREGDLMAVLVVLLLLGLVHIVNGGWMLLAPDSWYATIPGVGMTGPINHHFIADIGLAFVASGAGLALGARSGVAAAIYAIAGATWPALHALLHVYGWLEHGFPTQADVALSETVGVVLVGALGVIAAWARARKEGVV